VSHHIPESSPLHFGRYKRCPKISNAHGVQCQIWEGHLVPCVYFTGDWSEEQVDVVKAEVAMANLRGFRRGIEETTNKLEERIRRLEEAK